MKKTQLTKVKAPKKELRFSPEIDTAARTARHYGFSEMPEIGVGKKDVLYAKKFHLEYLKPLHPFFEKSDRFGGFLEEKIALLNAFFDKKFAHLGVPVMGYYRGPLKGNPHMKKNFEEETFNLEIIGGSKSISEATIIETAMIILKERYPKVEFSVIINSIGDKDSYAKYLKELAHYLSKTNHMLEKVCSDKIKKDIGALFNCYHERCKSVQESAPRPMAYLSSQSQKHFKEVLEYLESLGIPYEIDHSLIGSRSYCSDTVFEIVGKEPSETEDRVFCIGERYNGLTKKALGKKDLSAIGAAILIHPHFVKRKMFRKKEVKAKFFYIQIGFGAKLKSLALIETLRQAQIPVVQSLSKDKLSAQLAQAEKMAIPYIIMMGQKESNENSVLIRNMETMEQDTVNIDSLVKFLGKLK